MCLQNRGKFIVTYGKVEISVPADYASLSFSVTEKGSSLREALEKTKGRVGQITAALINLGLEKENLSTSKFYSGENFDGKSFFSSKNDYKTEMTTFLKVDSIGFLEEVLLTISDFKPDNISDVSFEISNPEEFKLQALEAAIKKAKEKANLLAKNMDVELTKPMEIIETKSSSITVLRGGRINLYNSVYEVDKGSTPGGAFFRESLKISAEVELKITVK
ncbi:MAG: SIMPL domain-containing protein [Flavobacteriales bacterium]|nr:SIMPL domain-containing protein [Flavobacteriales bacterium]